MIVLGVILLLLGLIAPAVHFLFWLGAILLIIGAVFAILGGMGHEVGGRSHWW